MPHAYAPRTVNDLAGLPPPPPHLIHNVCREAGSILLFGRTGIGKTRLLWQLACGWAAGAPVFDLAPARPLRITFVEADMFRSDFEALIRDLATAGLTIPPTLCWFCRDDDSPYFIDSFFGQTLHSHNDAWSTDLTIYDAIPDMHLGDPNDQRIAYQTLRALHKASINRAYLGVLVQRKSAKTDRHEDIESVDEMLGSQGWGRQASTVWQMTNVPSLVWVKHRLCERPDPITLIRGASGIFQPRAAAPRGLILAEAAAGFTSARELADRVQALSAYAQLSSPYKDRMLRSLIAGMISRGEIIPRP